MRKSAIWLMLKWSVWVLPLVLVALTSCQYQSHGFVLPKGDVAEGKTAFLELNCNNCHYTDEIEWTGNADWNDPKIHLGGEVSQIKTYGELVTSVINPSHKISKNVDPATATLADGSSKMETYALNYKMTVQELIDIIAFLQSEYELVVPESNYPY